MKTNTEHQRCKFLVSKFVSKEGMNWPREIRIAKKLLKEYPDFETWTQLKFDFKLNSLAFFLTEEGKEKIQILKFNKSKKNLLDLFPKQEEVVFGEKLGQDAEVQKKPLTLKDFLKKKF